MTDTKQDPVLPPPSHRHPMSGEPIWDETAARACYAQARADLIAELREQARYWQDPDAPLANPSAVRRVGWLPLAIIPEK